MLKYPCIICRSVDEKSSKDLRHYLSNLAEQCESNNSTSDCNELPSVIILDNLHLASSLSDVLNSLLNVRIAKSCPYIIGTINQSNCAATNLQLHQNFRLVKLIVVYFAIENIGYMGQLNVQIFLQMDHVCQSRGTGEGIPQ